MAAIDSWTVAMRFWRPVIAALSLAAAVPARAELRVCNKTDNMVALAVGVYDGKEWSSRGWFYAPPKECATLIKGALSSRFYYLHGVHLSVDGGWEGNRGFCVSEKNFTISGRTDCEKRGYKRAGFIEIDTGETESWTTTLSD
jgi:uncharacterized membrane protein